MKPSRRDSSRRILNRAYNPVVRVVARLPATVNRKLLIAFVGIVVLLVTVGVLGLRVLGDANDRVALNTLAELFPQREIIGINCRDLVLGLGTVHCLSQQQPAPNKIRRTRK